MKKRRSQKQDRRSFFGFGSVEKKKQRVRVPRMEHLENRALLAVLPFINLTGGPGDDLLTINATGPDSGTYQLNGNAAVSFTGNQTFTFVGGGGADLFVINNPSGDLFGPAGGIFFDGGGQDGLLRVVGGAADSGSYSVGVTPDSGNILHFKFSTGHVQNISFSRVLGAFDSVAETTSAVNASDADNAISYANAVTPGDGLVSIDSDAPYEFANKAVLIIDGAGGSDTISVNNPTTPTGLTGIIVNGGDPTAGSDTLIVNGTSNSDDISYSPSGTVGAGSVQVNAQPAISFAGMEAVTLNGLGGDDAMTFTSPTNFSNGSVLDFRPGAFGDSATITGRNFGGNSFVPFTYQNVGVGASVTFASADGRFDTLDVYGSSAADDFAVGNNGLDITKSGEPFSISETIEIHPSSVQVLAVHGLGGDDSFDIGNSLPYSTLVVDGGDSSGGDKVNLPLASGAVALSISDPGNLIDSAEITGYGGTVELVGDEQVGLGLAGNALTVNGTGLPDSILYSPTGSDSGNIQVAGLNTLFQFSNGTGSAGGLKIDPQGGSNVITVNGTSGNDAITVSQSGGNASIQINGLQALTIPSANVASLVIKGGGGNDTLTADDSGGLVTIPISYDGGDGSDTLMVQGSSGNVQTSYSLGGGGGGAIVGVSGNNTQSITFTNLEPVIDTNPGTLTVNGTNADNAISYTQGSSASNGLVAVDNYETYEFSNKTALTINAGGGNDTISLNNPTTPTGLTGITVNGGDPTAGSDSLVVNGRPGVQDDIRVTPTGAGAGTVIGAGVTVTFATTEQLNIVGQAADRDILRTVGTAGADTYEVVPGAVADAGSITGFSAGASGFSFTPIAFSGIKGFIGPGVGFTSADTAIIDGTLADDTIRYSESTAFPGFRSAQVNNDTEIFFDSPTIVLRGLAGNDTFNTSFTPAGDGRAIRIEGGDGTDVINHTANSNAATTIDLGASTIATTGGNTITFAGVEQINQTSSGGSSTLSITGTASPDNLTYTPTGATAGTVTGVGPTVNFTGVGSTFSIDAGDDSDTVTVNGTSAADTINVVKGATATVQVGSLKIVGLPSASDENVVVAAGDGSDTINISGTTNNGQIFNVQGSDPTASDTLNITMSTAGVTNVIPGQTPDAGVITSPDGSTTFSGIEAISVSGLAGGSNLLGVVGTNGNDTIELAHLFADRVWVNDRAQVTFTNYSFITVVGEIGQDRLSISPVGLSAAITQIQIDADSDDSVVVNGSTASENIGCFTFTNGVNVSGLGPTVFVANTSNLTINGQGGNDHLTVTTPAGQNVVNFDPGNLIDQGTISIRQFLSSGGAEVPSLAFTNLGGLGTLSFNNFGGRQDALVVNAHDAANASDEFDVDSAGVVTVKYITAGGATNETLPISTPGVSFLTLNGLAGDDTFNIPGNHPFSQGLLINGGEPSGSDVLNFTGSGTAANLITVNFGAETVQEAGFAAVSFAGVETVNVDANGLSAIFVGTAGADSIDVTPTGVDDVTVRDNATSPAFNFSNVGATFTVDGAGTGAQNTLNFYGTSAPDTFNLSRGGITQSLQRVGTQLVTTTSTFFSFNVLGGDNADTFNINDGPAFTAVEVNLDGGSDSGNVLNYFVPFNQTFQPGDTNFSGAFLINNGTAGAVNFSQIDHANVTFNNPAQNVATVSARGGANQITAVGTASNSVAVTVDDGPLVSFTGLSTLNLNGNGGDDQISVTPGPLTINGINVSGGDPTASDELIVNGTGGVDTIGYNPSSTIGSGSVTISGAPTVNFTTTESVTINGAGGDDNLTYTSPIINSFLTFTPGATVNSGSVDGRTPGASGNIAYTPLSYINVGRNGTLTFANSMGSTDTLIYNGTSGDDVFGYSQPLTPPNSISLATPVTAGFLAIPVIATSVSSLFLSSQDGDDVFNLPGPLPYTSLVLEGGDPSASDVVNLSGASGPVTVDLGAQTVTGFGGVVSLAGIETLNLDAGANSIAIIGTTGPDNISVTPTGASTTTITSAGLNLTINTTNSGTLTVDTAGSSDAVSVIGSSSGETIAVVRGASTTVQRTAPVAWKQVSIVNAEAIDVAGDQGDDTFNVSGAGGPASLTIDGGPPSASDSVIFTSNVTTTAFSFTPGTTNDSGAVTMNGSTTQLTGIEAITLNAANLTGADSVTINGNAAANQITYTGTGAGAATVRIDAFPTISLTGFSASSTASLLAGAGDDVISITGGTAANIALTVNGGDPTASDSLVVNGTSGTDTVTIDQFTTDGARITGLGPTITAAAIERLTYNGQGGNDTLTVISPSGADTITDTAGATVDSGTVQVNALLPVQFTNLGSSAQLTLADANGVRVDSLVVLGTSRNDFFSVAPTTGQITSSFQIAVNASGVVNLTLNGLDDDDLFVVTAPTPFDGITLEGGGSSVNGNQANITLSGAPVGMENQDYIFGGGLGVNGMIYQGMDKIFVNAGGGNVTYFGSGFPDDITVTPDGAHSAELHERAISPGFTMNAQLDNLGALTINNAPFGGNDTVTIDATTASDAITVARGATTTVTVGGLQPIGVVASGTNSLLVNAGLGNDTVTVSGGGGAPLTIDGGGPTASDTLNLSTGAAANVSVTFGTDPSSGVIADSVAGDVAFTGIEHIGLTGSGATSLTINGTNGDDAINQNGNVVTINNGAAINFAAYPTLTLNGNSGDDAFNVNSTTLTGVTTFSVSGGDPTASDTLIANGTTAADTIDYSPTGLGLGTVTINALPVINFTTIEQITLNGQGGGDALTYRTPAGHDRNVYTPGDSPDAGTITTRSGQLDALVPLTFNHLGTNSTVAFVSGAGAGTREDRLDMYGTDNSDHFFLGGATDTLFAIHNAPTAGNITPALNIAGIDFLSLRGLDGDDRFDVGGPLAYADVDIDGGDPSASDVLNFTAIGNGSTTVDMQAGTVHELATPGVVSITGIEVLNVDAAGQEVQIIGTTGDDVLDVSSTGPNSGTATLTSSQPYVGSRPVVNFFNASSNSLVASLGNGDDKLIARYSSGDDTINVNEAAGVISSPGFIDVEYTGVDSLAVYGNEGNDTFNVTPGPIPVFVDGGDPIGVLPGDTINLAAGGGTVTFDAGPQSDEGGFTVAGGLNPGVVSFDHIETLNVSGGPSGATINGTNGNDVITIIARDSSNGPATADGVQDFTVSVNDGPDIYFENTPALAVNALSGNDQIVVFAPAPNLAVWDVDLTIDGGQPTASDTVIFGTPGTDTVLFTPTGANSAIVSITNLSSVSVLTNVEHVIYDGQGGGDTLTINGTAADDQAAVNPTNGGSGSFSSSASPSFSFTGATTITVDGGVGGFDVLAVEGTQAGDVVGVAGTVVTLVGTVNIGAGIDRFDLSTLGGNDTITVTGLTATSIMDAGDGDDSVSADATVTAAMTIYGGIGNDTIGGGAASDLIYGGDGNDTISGGAGADIIYGGDGNDTVTAGVGNDLQYGGAGSDTFIWNPGDGSDVSEGGDGVDAMIFNGAAANEVFTLTNFNTQVAGAQPDGRFYLSRNVGNVNMNTAGVEQVTLSALGGADQVIVNDLYLTEVVNLNIDLGVAGAGDAATDAVSINGRNVNDNLSISASAAGATGVRVTGLRYDVSVLNAETTDSLTVNGNEGDDSITVGVGANAVMNFNLNGNDGNDAINASATLASATTAMTFNGGAGNDTLIGGADNDTMDGGAGDDTFIGNGGTDAIGGGLGTSVGDTILLPGTTGNDTFSLALNASGFLLATVNGLTTTYTNFLAGPVATSGIEQIFVDGLAGADSLTVDSTNGAVPIAINFDGGLDADRLNLNGGTATSDIYAPGPNSGQGTSTIVIGGVTQVVTFVNLEPVIDLVAGPLTVNANNANNAINYRVGRNDTDTADDTTRGRVSVDALETIDFSNKTTLTINALAGDDVINLNNPNTPTGLTSINVNGSDPTASDTVVVNGTAGVDTINYNPTAADAGNITGLGPTINLATVENVTINGQGATDTLNVTTPAGLHFVTYTPGVDASQGRVSFRVNNDGPLLSMNYVGFDSLSTLRFADAGGGRADTLFYQGTSADDRFDFLGTGTVRILTPPAFGGARKTLDVNLPGIASLDLIGFSGDDTFNVPGNHPFTQLVVEGGDPSASDTLNFTGSGTTANLITANYGVATVTEATFAPVNYTGIETINIAAATHNVTVVGTSGNDKLDVTPTGAAAATVSLTSSDPSIGSTPVINASNLGATFTVDADGGTDTVAVNGTDAGETTTVTGGLVTVGALATVNYTGAENLAVYGQAGSDTFNVTPSATTLMFIDGGDPIGVLPGDTLAVAAGGGGVTFNAGPESDEGGFVVTGGANPGTVSFDHIESIAPITNAGAATINGTNADDDITIIARNQVNYSTASFPGTAADGFQDFTVSVNAGPDIYFENTPLLTVDAKNGDDEIFLQTPAPAPNPLPWNVQVTLIGGSPTGGGLDSDILVVDTPGDNVVTYTPTSSSSGTLLLDETADSLITINSLENLFYDGLNGNDTITIVGTAANDTITHAPGAANNQGNFLVNNLLPIDYQNLGAASTLTINGGGGTDTLVALGTDQNDTFNVANSLAPSPGAVTLNARLALNQTNVEGLKLSGLDGDDTFDIPGNHPYTAGISVQAGDPSASDVVNFTASATVANLVTVDFGASTVQEATFGPVSLSGVELLNANANGHNLTVNGTSGNDAVNVTPTGAAAATVTLTSDLPSVGSVPVVNASNIGATFIVDAAAGTDTVTVTGTSTPDTIEVVKGATTTVQVNALKTVSLPAGSDEDVNIAAGDGEDTINISGTTASSQIINVDGGIPTANAVASDRLTITMSTAGTTGVIPGATPDAGSVTSPDGQTNFSGIEFVVVTGTAAGANTLSAQGTNAGDSFALQFLNAANRVWVNDRAVVTFSNYQTVNLNGMFGDDKFSVSSVGLVGVTTINVGGGDPTASDTVVVNGSTGVDNINYSPTAADAGNITGLGATINLTTVENVTINGQGAGDTLVVTTPAGQHHITYTPGADATQGSVTMRVNNGGPLLSMNYLGFDALSTLRFADAGGGRADLLYYQGTSADDRFDFVGTGTVRILGPAAFITPRRTLDTNLPGIQLLDFIGFAGDDTFNVPGNHPFTNLVVEGGDPSASDTLNFTGSATTANLITSDLGGSTISEATFAPVSYTGIEVLNVDAANHSLTVLATGGDDAMSVTPTGTAAATIALTSSSPSIGSRPVENASNIGTLLVDLLGGSDQLTVNGTQGVDAITVTSASVTVNPTIGGPFEQVNYTNTEDLRVSSQAGDDTITVGPTTTTTTMFIDGGDPIGSTPGDRLVVIPPAGAFAIEPGPESDEGGVHFAGAARLSFDHIEAMTVIGSGTGVGPAEVLGTGADDDITIIARDSSTHVGADGVQDFTVNVNDGPEILFLNTPNLFVDAGAGDDDIVVREPAPNLAAWNVQLTIAGGPAAAATGSQGDVFELETPGTQTVTFTPTGVDTATVTDATNTSTFNLVNTFTIPGFATSSPGGVEQVVYQGLAGGDNLTINGTANNDTTIIHPTDTGSGTFSSSLSPAFSFVGATTITVDGGSAGTADSVEIDGTLGPDVVTSTATSVILGGTVNLGAGLDQLFVNTFDGNDSIILSLTSPTLAKTINAGNGADIVNVSGSVDATIFGGAGDDTLTGSPNFDYIDGGDGDDTIIGGGGNDELLGNTGSDTFIWNAGDGSDVVEGGADESDLLIFNGAAAAETFTLSQNPSNLTRLLLTRDVGGVNMSIAGVEQVNVNGAGGSDTFVINDLYLTDVRKVSLDLGAADPAADSVTINGRDVADQVSIVSPGAGALAVTGLRYDVNLSNITLADNDNFTFNANGGNDIVTTADDLSALFTSSNVSANNTFTINGGAGDDVLSSYGRLLGADGNDTLTGLTSSTLTNFSQFLAGGPGNDTLTGGTGLDSLVGGPGDDTFIPGFDLQNDTIDGGDGFDTILVQGTPGNDRIDLIQDSPTQLRYNLLGVNGGTGVVGGPGTETDVLVSGTVEEVKVLALAGDDQIRVTQSDSLIANNQQALSLRFTVDASSPGASDRLTVADNGLGDTTIQRIGAAAGTGSYQIGALAPIVYYDVEYTSLISTDLSGNVVPLNPITGGYGTDGLGKLFVFKPDPYESNNTLANASFLGSGPAINVDPTIDPSFDVPFGAPGDEDWYRIVAQTTGDLDIRVFFKQQGPLANGRAGLPGNGNLDVALYDIDGIITGFATGGAIAGVGTFGSNESAPTDSDERIRIPAVAGQTYYLRVRGAPTAGPLTNANGATASDSSAVNVYSVSVINTPVATPYDGEVDDIIANSSVTAVVSDTQFSGGATLSSLDDFYNQKDIYFTNGPLNGQRGRVIDYVGATHTFVFAPFTFTQAPVVGETFQIESFDTGRSQLDNITRDNTPIIRFRLDDAWLLHDVPGNPVGGNQLDPGQGPILIPFSGNSAAQRETNSTVGINAGFRVAIFDEGTPQQPGQLPQVPIGYARQIAEGVYEFDFERDRIVGGAVTPYALTDGSHFLSARVQIVDPSDPNAGAFGDRSQSLEVVVDTQIPPVFFGLPNVPDDGLLPDSDTGVNANPETLTDRVTSDTTPGFFGQAEADAVIRLFVDLNADGTTNPDGTGDGIFEPSVDFQVGFTTAQPYDGTNQYPTGYWQIDAINFNLNAPPFPHDGQRTLFLTAEDVAGNINPATGVIRLDIFIDTTGPQVTDVTINSSSSLLGLTDSNSLVKFDSSDPNTIISTTPVLNLGANTLQALDVLPGPVGNFLKGTLFGFATNAAGTLGQVYAIIPSTGFATPIGGSFAITPSTGYDIDFNPTSGKLRIVDSSNDNLRFDVTTGTVVIDSMLTAGADIVGAAYDRNDLKPSPLMTPFTTLFDIDSTTDALTMQGGVNGIVSPNSGIITTVGPLGVDTDANVGFDIAKGTNTAFASLHAGGKSGLYTIDLVTGAASLVGFIGTGATVIRSLTVLPAYDLFDPKPSTDGPTPPVNSIVIDFQDLPNRTAMFLVDALKEDVAASPGLYHLVGDHNGIIPIQQVIVHNIPPMAGEPALATVELVFRLPGPDGIFNTPDDIGAPLPDDRFTLTVDDDIIDLAGNHLDGESNASEPLEFPTFPSGDLLPGGDFIARFTIDSRPEVGNYSAGSSFIDINGNLYIDPQGNDNDYTNRDLSFQIGTISDSVFAGKFEPAAMAQNDNDGFDKLGAYGFDNTAKQYRFLLDFDHDGVADQYIVSAFQVNGIPVAGNFAPSHPGDEIGLFDGKNWYLDTVGDNQLHTKIVSNMPGNPIVGDFNGDGSDDLATFDAGKNIFYFDTNRDGIADDSLAVTGPFNGFTDLPVAGDYNLDGIDDLGIWVPNRQGSPTTNISEWYFLISDHIGQTFPHNVFDQYAPTPLGNDVFAQFGDHFSLPIFGNFDPPTAASTPVTNTNTLNALDVNNDGVVAPNDVLAVINQINTGIQPLRSAGLSLPPYTDVNADKFVSAIDSLMIINYLNAHPLGGASGGEGEGESTVSLDAQGQSASSNALDEDLLSLLAADSTTLKRQRGGI